MSIDYLVEKYSKLVYKICFNMLSDSLDAEDITQEVYLSLYNNLERYKDLSENEIKNIICKIALNKCRDILKSKVKKLDNMIDNSIEDLENIGQSDSIEEKVVKEDNNEYIINKIMELKEPYKTLIYEYYINEISLDELAIKRGTTKGTLKMQIHRGKEYLKNIIKSEGGVDFL